MYACATGLVSLVLLTVPAGCAGGLGACDSTGRYCGDDYTEEECDERNGLKVNGESWYFHAGQTCSDRGKSSTS